MLNENTAINTPDLLDQSVPFHSQPNPKATLGGDDIVVVGTPVLTKNVCAALKHAAGNVRQVSTVNQAVMRGLDRAMAHVLVTPLTRTELTSAVSQLLEAGPVFVVVPDDFSDARARELYEAGTHAVFEWPGEALLLPHLVTERLRIMSLSHRPSSDGDEALERAIRTRLRFAKPLLPELTIDVSDGIVEISGNLDSYWKKERLSEILSNAPGVRSVITEGVTVCPPYRPDEVIERDIRGVSEIMFGTTTKTISISVRDGTVVLVGNVANREELSRLLVFVGNVRGVRSIENLVTVVPSACRQDQGMSERLNDALREIYPDCELSVACFGSVVAVRGRVPRLSTKREITDLVLHQDGIERIVDKIVVESPGDVA